MRDEDLTGLQVAFERRNKDLDPQLVWRGKDIQEKVDQTSIPACFLHAKPHSRAMGPKAVPINASRESRALDAFDKPGTVCRRPPELDCFEWPARLSAGRTGLDDVPEKGDVSVFADAPDQSPEIPLPNW
jgi:hypothetical protein